MNATAVFSPRAMLGWLAAVVAAFALSIYLLAFGGGAPEQRAVVGPSAYSRSAIGYAGLAELIRLAGTTVVKVRSGGASPGGAGKLVVLANPPTGWEDEDRYRFGDTDRVLIIMPKWYGYRNLRHSGWITDASPVPFFEGDRVLRKAGVTGRTARVPRPESFPTNALGIAPELPAEVQVIENTKLRPVVADGSRVLVGEQADGRRRIWIVADPDILSNHGLFAGRNAEFAITLINALVPPKGEVIFDEWVRGQAVPSGSNPLTLMLRFPFIVVTLELVAAAAFLLWAAMPRFGKPMPAPEILAAGKQSLIENAAGLLRYSGRPEVTIATYVRLSVRNVARELRSPAGLEWRQLIEWLTRIGTSRGVTVDFPDLVRRAEDLPTSRAGSVRTLVEIVQETHRWKREILNGP
ncbi:MAG: hypothetical protein J2P54_00255 [Bradyrhizobiaceae bacterium]|nr:hypothetical protein [Bradyrhizobiaceae bacterium]